MALDTPADDPLALPGQGKRARKRPNDEAKKRTFQRGSTHRHPHSLVFFLLSLDHSPIRACLVTHDVVEGLQDGVAIRVEIYAHDGEEEARVERERNRACASLGCWGLTELPPHALHLV